MCKIACSYAVLQIPPAPRPKDLWCRDMYSKLCATSSGLKATSSTDRLCLASVLAVGRGNCRPLHGLAELSDIHGLPALDGRHALEEQARGASRVHVALDVLVVHRSLLEDADAIVIGALAVVVVLQRSRHFVVCEDLNLRLC